MIVGIYAPSVNVAACLALLRRRNIPFDAGLSERELRNIEDDYDFEFSDDHRDFLAAAQPTGKGWINWRSGIEAQIRSALDWPFEGVLFDVENNVFWPSSWGTRPTSSDLRRDVTRLQVSSWPRLVPIWGHRYMPAAPVGRGAPVFSVYQTDVVLYGDDLFSYLQQEFEGKRIGTKLTASSLIPWTMFAFGEDLD